MDMIYAYTNMNTVLVLKANTDTNIDIIRIYMDIHFSKIIMFINKNIFYIF